MPPIPVLADLGYRLVRVKMSGRLAGHPAASWRNVRRHDDDRRLRGRQQGALAGPRPRRPHCGRLSPRDFLAGHRPSARPRLRSRRALGHEARIELAVALDGRRRFRGLIAGHERRSSRCKRLDANASEPATADLADRGHRRRQARPHRRADPRDAAGSARTPRPRTLSATGEAEAPLSASAPRPRAFRQPQQARARGGRRA